jgi:hypothetical protein
MNHEHLMESDSPERLAMLFVETLRFARLSCVIGGPHWLNQPPPEKPLNVASKGWLVVVVKTPVLKILSVKSFKVDPTGTFTVT